MPSKFVVGLSLDEELFKVWNDLPIGERSRKVREALSDAEIVERREMTIEALRKQIKHARRIIRDVSIFSSDEKIKNLVDEYLAYIDIMEGIA